MAHNDLFELTKGNNENIGFGKKSEQTIDPLRKMDFKKITKQEIFDDKIAVKNIK